MIKILCDRCGSEMTNSSLIGYLSLNFKEGLDGDLMRNPLENNHYCMSCMSKIHEFIDARPNIELAEPAQLELSEPGKAEPELVPDAEPGETESDMLPEPAPEPLPEVKAESEPMPKTKAKSTVKPPDMLSASPEPNKPKRRTIDYGKIMALKNAGWSREQIADEMGMTPNAVSNAVYMYNKKKGKG